MKHFFAVPSDTGIQLYDQYGNKIEHNRIEDAHGHQIILNSNGPFFIRVDYPITFVSSVKDVEELKEKR